MLRCSIWIFATTFSLSLAVAQEEPPPPPAGPAAQEVLRRALAGEAVDRLLVPRWFEDESGGVVRFTGERLEGGGLRLRIAFLPVAAMREELTRLSCDVGPDGALRAVESESVRGEERTTTRGEVSEGKLHLRVEPAGETSTTAWSEEVLPLPLLVFALPALCDQGLPARLSVRVFHGFARTPEEKVGTLTWEERDGAWQVTITSLGEGQPGSRVAVEKGTGTPREVVISGMRLTPITPEEGARRVKPAKKR